MKNKKSIYFLLPVVLGIWFYLIYSVFTFLDQPDAHDNNSQGNIYRPLGTDQKKQSDIDVNYRDPFLGKMYNAVHEVPKKKRNRVVEEKQPVLPQIIYRGIVSDTKDKISVFMVIVNGQTFLMKKGEVQNDVFLKSGGPTSIEIKYKGVTTKVLLQT